MRERERQGERRDPQARGRRIGRPDICGRERAVSAARRADRAVALFRRRAGGGGYLTAGRRDLAGPAARALAYTFQAEGEGSAYGRASASAASWSLCVDSRFSSSMLVLLTAMRYRSDGFSAALLALGRLAAGLLAAASLGFGSLGFGSLGLLLALGLAAALVALAPGVLAAVDSTATLGVAAADDDAGVLAGVLAGAAGAAGAGSREKTTNVAVLPLGTPTTQKFAPPAPGALFCVISLTPWRAGSISHGRPPHGPSHWRRVSGCARAGGRAGGGRVPRCARPSSGRRRGTSRPARCRWGSSQA